MSGGGIMGVISIFMLKAISENKSEGNRPWPVSLVQQLSLLPYFIK